MANFISSTVKANAIFFCKEIAKVACFELYDKELNHAYSREYRAKALALCIEHATAKAVRKVYDIHCHDHYIVDDNVINYIVNLLIEKVKYENGRLSIGGLSTSAYD